MEVFRQAAETYTRDLLARIAKDYGLDLPELEERYLGAQTPVAVAPTAAPTRPRPTPLEKTVCTAITSSGTGCRFYARQDGLCGKHCQTAPRPEVALCSGQTAKGGQCRFAAKQNGLCGTHCRTVGSRAATPQPQSRAVTPPPQSREATPPPPEVVRPTPPTAPPEVVRPTPTQRFKETAKKAEKTARKAPIPLAPVELEEEEEDEEEESTLQARLRAILKESASESDEDPEDDDEDEGLVSLSELLDD